ncbi:MAG TPA: glycosyltransferase family protein, partial [Sediminibacterium sp.]|nr:glycosyltransferase family protein [Sediminibacterium sp.]
MKIFYAIQATGNGHISRAMEIMPYLQQYGQVDVFLSGSNSHLQPNLPVRYRSAGVSLFYGNKGGLDYWRMWKELHIRHIWQEAKALPVEEYDIVLNDFESITALACRLKRISSLGFGHQASFQSRKTPRAKRFDPAGEWVLRHYAPATDNLGLHFRAYDSNIYSPIIKREIIDADPMDKGHITVYLSHYSDEVVLASLQQLPDVHFEVFSKKVKRPVFFKNCRLLPI